MIDLIFDCAILFGIILIYVKLRGRMDKMEARMEEIYSDISFRMAINDIAKDRIDNKLSAVATTISEIKDFTKPKLEVSSATICVDIPDGENQSKKKISTRTTKKKNNK